MNKKINTVVVLMLYIHIYFVLLFCFAQCTKQKGVKWPESLMCKGIFLLVSTFWLLNAVFF